MSVQHLVKGSELPPYNGKLRVYSMKFGPYAHRTSLVLSAKNVAHEVVNINLSDKPEWYTTKSPMGKVPALEVDKDVVILESLVTAEYLDDKYPQPPLVSKDPLQKALDKLIVENFNKVTAGFYKVVLSRDYSDANVADFRSGLEQLQNEMKKRNTKFLGGSSPGMVDYMIWPWFERFGVLPKFSGNQKFALDSATFGTLNSWVEAMKKDKAVKANYLDEEAHEKYMTGLRTGNYEYDFLA